MGRAAAAKIALLVMLVAVGYGSTRVRFETAALDDRASSTKADRRLAELEIPQRAALTDAELVETYARPLFSPSRRPFVPKPVVVEQPVAVVEQPVISQPVTRPRRLSLIGTNVSGPAVSVLVRNKESEEVQWLKVGQAFDGWILSSAGADHAVFICHEKRGDDCEYRLALYSDPGGQ